MSDTVYQVDPSYCFVVRLDHAGGLPEEADIIQWLVENEVEYNFYYQDGGVEALIMIEGLTSATLFKARWM